MFQLVQEDLNFKVADLIDLVNFEWHSQNEVGSSCVVENSRKLQWALRFRSHWTLAMALVMQK